MTHSLFLHVRIFVLFLTSTIFCLVTTTAVASPPPENDIFATDHLIQVEVKMDPQDWHELRIGHRVTGADFSQIVESPYEYYPADVVIDGRELKAVKIRKKGFFGSVISTRPSLKIKLGEYKKDPQFNGLDRMTFNNNNQDPTQAQTLLVYKFMNKAGANSPRSNLARIIVNGEDLGIYSHVESVRKPFIKRQFGKSKGVLYEGFAGDFTSNEFVRIVDKWGKDEDKAQLMGLYDLLQNPQTLDLGEIEKLIDIDSFITFWVSEALIGHWDGYATNRNNFYIYREHKTGLLYFIPWGPDSAFNDPGPFIHVDVPKSFKARGYMCERLWELPEVRARYRREMARQLNEVWDEQEMLAELKQVRNLTRSYSTVTNEAADKRVHEITEFIQNRRQEVQAELDVVAADWPDLGGIFKPGAGAVMEISGEFSSQFELPVTQTENEAETDEVTLFATIPASLLGKGQAKIEYSVDGVQQQPFERYGARTTPGDPLFIRKGYPVIEILAESDSGHPAWRLSLIIDPHQVVEGSNQLAVDHYTVWARILQGDPGSDEAQSKGFGISGTLELDHFSREPGAMVSGRFHLKTSAFQSVAETAATSEETPGETATGAE